MLRRLTSRLIFSKARRFLFHRGEVIEQFRKLPAQKKLVISIFISFKAFRQRLGNRLDLFLGYTTARTKIDKAVEFPSHLEELWYQSHNYVLALQGYFAALNKLHWVSIIENTQFHWKRMSITFLQNNLHSLIRHRYQVIYLNDQNFAISMWKIISSDFDCLAQDQSRLYFISLLFIGSFHQQWW